MWIINIIAELLWNRFFPDEELAGPEPTPGLQPRFCCCRGATFNSSRRRKGAAGRFRSRSSSSSRVPIRAQLCVAQLPVLLHDPCSLLPQSKTLQQQNWPGPLRLAIVKWSGPSGFGSAIYRAKATLTTGCTPADTARIRLPTSLQYIATDSGEHEFLVIIPLVDYTNVSAGQRGERGVDRRALAEDFAPRPRFASVVADAEGEVFA